MAMGGGPGPVNWVIGRIARSTSMPGWDDFPVRDELADHYGVPAVVDNDANLLGLGAQRQVYPEAYLVLLMKVGTGIGASVVLDRELLRGSESAEGDIGHAPRSSESWRFAAAAIPGCLAATASGRVMVRDLRRLGHPTQHDPGRGGARPRW